MSVPEESRAGQTSSPAAQEPQERPSGPAAEGRPEGEPIQDMFRGVEDHIWDKDELKKTYGPEVHIHYNVYQGNYVNNSGIIGGIDQRQGGADGGPAGAEEGAEAWVRSFFQPDKGLAALAALIALATFQVTPEAVFHDAARSLRAALAELTGAEEQDAPASLQTARELLSPFPIQYVDDPDPQDPRGPGGLCLTFQRQDDAGRIREQIWRDYPQLRGTLTGWLLELRRRTDSHASRRMGYAAMQGLACYASLDLAYGRDTLIPLLEQSCAAQADVKYLTVFFRQLLLWEHSRKLADRLLCRWCGRSGGILWQVPYRLFDQGGGLDFQGKVSEALELRLKWDLSQNADSPLDWYKQDRGYLLRPAHESAETAQLLAQGLSRCFAQRWDYPGRYGAAVYFLALFRWDYLTDFSAQPNLAFLRCLHTQNGRAALLPLFQFVWRRMELRGMAQQVLACHMREINLYHAPWAYLEKPFLYLAFTGRSTDYNNTLYLLKACARQEDAEPVARHLIDFLTKRLKEPRGDNTRTGKV